MESSLILVWQGGWIRAILQGAAITIAVGTVSMLVGALIGTLCGVIKWARIFPLTLVVDAYTSLVRGVPELLIIYLLFFSSVQFVTQVATAFGYAALADSGYAFIIAIIAIGTISGAYSTEVIRGALASIPTGHIESCARTGDSRAPHLQAHHHPANASHCHPRYEQCLADNHQGHGTGIGCRAAGTDARRLGWRR